VYHVIVTDKEVCWYNYSAWCWEHR